MKKNTTVDFHYIKTGNYCTHYANGVFGGITPRGELQIDFFLERQVIPKIATYEISDDGILGEISETEGKSGFVREIECGVVLNMDVAISFHQWLGQKIEEYTKIKHDKESR